MAGREPKRTPQRMRTFLEVLAETGRYRDAANAINVNYFTPFKWKQQDDAFRDACTQALATFDEAQAAIHRENCDQLEDEFFRRGMGWAEPVYSKEGHVVGTTYRYDTVAGCAYLNANRPDKYNQARRKSESEKETELGFVQSVSRALDGLAELGRNRPSDPDEGIGKA